MIGKTLGPYKILEQLGKGGMGEVWLAEDTRLDRKVAVKVLPGELASDVDRSSRFEQEAKAAAALNHPHIAAIHDVGVATAEGASSPTHFMVQEYLRGETLRETIARGTLTREKAIALCIEIGEALRAAHRAGIVHRDLKPENVFVTTDGHAKVLDFGLAKLTEAALPSDASATASPTMTMAGMMLGTAGYMAPEQVRGEEVDERADLFALGCVLYETVTGKQAFGGANVHESLSRILTGEPEPMAAAGSDLGQLRWIVDKLLNKDREERYQSAGDAIVDLRRLAAGGETGEPAPVAAESEARTSRSLAPLIAVAAVALLVGALGAWLLKPGTGTAANPDVRFDMMLGPGANFSSNYNRVATISPDGRTLAYASTGIWLRDLGDLEPRRIDGVDGARSPAFSPDSRQVVFWDAGHVKRIALGEKLPVVVGPFRERPMGIHWNEDGYVYVGRADQGIWRLPATGGEPEQVLALESGEYAHGPELLPGGEWMLYTLGRGVRAWSNASIVAQSLETDERKVLVQRGREARYVRSGHLVYVLDGAIYAAPFDLDRLEVTGRSVAMEDEVHTSSLDETGSAAYDVSDDGILAFAPPATGAREVRLSWRDGMGNEEPLPFEKRRFTLMRLSPDEKTIAVQIDDVEGTHVWLFSLNRGGGQRLTTVGRNIAPVWSHDGRYVYFGSDREGELDIWRRVADLSEPAERVLEMDGAQVPSATSSDGEWLLFEQAVPSNTDIARLKLSGDPEVEMLVDSLADESTPDLSADGKFFCFQSDETGRWDIHVMEIATGRRWIVSPNSGYTPLWSDDGKSILYLGTPAAGVTFEAVFRVGVATEPEFEATDPEQAFEIELLRIGRTFDANADASRLVTGTPSFEYEGDLTETRSRITVILNWFDELEERLGEGGKN
ncbi:MAG: protein kinase [Acidobacteria bacterium]|nr:protein kinase [Acidobacteriota bacterium]NIM62501.1 protein kinase [Acidobacteriota bacterium]NIO60572.1 protein kinase [Acidobacteriota bacterium]NIQ29307.1 protein kinase [Acidobacteriota bacterium]NIQ83907.1 protein kinase [Acidobacteriota bacterium]